MKLDRPKPINMLAPGPPTHAGAKRLPGGFRARVLLHFIIQVRCDTGFSDDHEESFTREGERIEDCSFVVDASTSSSTFYTASTSP